MSDKLVYLYTCVDMGEALVFRSVLEDHGIPVYLQGENHRSLMGMVGSFVELRILVAEGYEVEAKRILEGLESIPFEGGGMGEQELPMEALHQEEEVLLRTSGVDKLYWPFLLISLMGFGVVHWYARAMFRATFLMFLDIYAVFMWYSTDRIYLLLHLLVIVVDVIAGSIAVAERKKVGPD